MLKNKSISQDSLRPNEDLLMEETNFTSLIKSAIEAINLYDDESLETILLKSTSQMSQPKLIEHFIVPLVYRIGELWNAGELRVANEHMASAVIRTFLANQIENYSFSENSPIIVCATPRGQEHEFGALIAGLVAASSGWRVIYLGTNLPIEEIAAVATSVDVKAIALSIVYPADDPKLKKDLFHLQRILPQQISIIVGGRSANNYLDVLNKIGAIIVSETKRFRSELEAIRNNKFN